MNELKVEAVAIALLILSVVQGVFLIEGAHARTKLTLELAARTTELAKAKNEHAEQVARANAAQLQADQHYRALEQQMNAVTKEKDDALAQARLEIARRSSTDRAVIDGLRDQLRAWAAAPAAGQAPDAAAEEYRARAAAAGDLLEDGLRVQATLAAAAESHAAEVRNLLGRERAMTCGGG